MGSCFIITHHVKHVLWTVFSWKLKTMKGGSSCLGRLKIYLSVRPVVSVNVPSMHAVPASHTFALSTAVLVCNFFYFSFTPRLNVRIMCCFESVHFVCFSSPATLEQVGTHIRAGQDVLQYVRRGLFKSLFCRSGQSGVV